MAESWVQAPERALKEADADEILRFHRAERHLHWAIAIPFMLCYATAAVLVLVYNQNPAWPLRAVFSWAHRISGGCLIVLPPLAVARHWREFRIHVGNVRWGWKWSLDDVKWLALMGPATFSSRIALPHQGKFNAGEKINFIVVMCTYPVYIVTGLTIWFAGVPFVSWLVHVCTATFVATPLMMGHIFMALVNPDTRIGLSGMLSGFVDRRWARHHYRHWYDETFGGSPDAERPVVDTELPALGATALLEESPPAVASATDQSPPPAPWPRLPGQVLGIEPRPAANTSRGPLGRVPAAVEACD